MFFNWTSSCFCLSLNCFFLFVEDELLLDDDDDDDKDDKDDNVVDDDDVVDVVDVVPICGNITSSLDEGNLGAKKDEK